MSDFRFNEPWGYSEPFNLFFSNAPAKEHDGGTLCLRKPGEVIGSMDEDVPKRREKARRIRVCVNAMAGHYPDNPLEVGAVTKAIEYLFLECEEGCPIQGTTSCTENQTCNTKLALRALGVDTDKGIDVGEEWE
jgi:hypothetical protein